MAERIRITFLGTGSAIPTARRSHTAIYLQYKAENILIDCGEGTQRQFRKARLNPCKVTKILITHWHGDHVLGLSGFLQTLALNGIARKVELYGPVGTKKKVREFFDTFMRPGWKMNLDVFEVDSGVFLENDGWYVEAQPAKHSVAANSYSFIVKEKNRLDRDKLAKLKIPNSPLIGKLVAGKTVTIDGKKVDGKKLLYTEPSRKVTVVLDTLVCQGAVLNSKDADLLICESSYSVDEAEIAKEHMHLTSKDACTIAKKAKVKNLILTHISQRYDVIPKKILSEAEDVLKATKIGVRVAEDFDEVVL